MRGDYRCELMSGHPSEHQLVQAPELVVRFRNDHERAAWGAAFAQALSRRERVGGGLGERATTVAECEELADEAVRAMRQREGLPRG